MSRVAHTECLLRVWLLPEPLLDRMSTRGFGEAALHV